MDSYSTLAPIVLFVYNRPWHTQQTLEALRQNELADQSVLFVYADGAKPNATDEDLRKITDVREVVKSQQWCKEVIVKESEKNKGLADSIIEGVTDTVNKFGKIIVLEDDIVTSKGFLKYMNDALNFYADQEKVYHISGYMFPVKKRLPPTFFFNTASCWGWGTWKRAWTIFNNDSQFLLSAIDEKGLKQKFNIEGSYDFYGQLEANKNGSLKTWAVKWYASFFLQNGFSLHPFPSLVNNIGHDGLGENCSISNIFNWKELAPSININKIDIEENKRALKAMIEFNETLHNQNLNSYSRKAKRFIQKEISDILPSLLKIRIKRFINKGFKVEEDERLRLQNMPRYQMTETFLLGKKIKILDAASFLFIYNELFRKGIYNFKTDEKKPYILDCGANIGLSVIYFKQRYPDAEIVAFEPDDKVFDALQFNIDTFQFSDVTLEKKACWNEETTLKFFSEGADAGRVAVETDLDNIIEVKAVRLNNYLNKTVNFLKMDVEGAESKVLKDCVENLNNVEKVFIEYHSFKDQKQTLSDLLGILSHAGFRYQIQDIGVFSQHPFIRIEDYNNMDLQLNIFAYRE